MIILDNTTRSLQVVLNAAKTTSDMPFMASYVDITTTSFTPISQNGTTNGTTTVTIVSSPALSTQRQLKYFSLYNADSASKIVSIQYNDNSTIRNVFVCLLQSGFTLTYNLDSGWVVADTNGSVQYVGNTGATGASGPAGATGPTGPAGVAGQPSYTTSSAGFTQPSSGSTVSVTVVNTSWMATGEILYTQDGSNNGGYYLVNSVTSATVVVLKNLGYSVNSSSGTTILSGATIVASGIQGATGATGANGTNGTNGTNGVNAYTTTSANFTQPAASSTVTINVVATAWMTTGQVVFIADGSNNGGYYSIFSIGSSTLVTITNLGYSGNSSSGTTVTSGAGVSPGGLIGQTGASGTNGASDYLYLTNN